MKQLLLTIMISGLSGDIVAQTKPPARLNVIQRKDSAVKVRTPVGSLLLPARTMYLSLPWVRDEAQKLTLVTVFDPTSGFYYVQFLGFFRPGYLESFSRDSGGAPLDTAFFMTADGLAYFTQLNASLTIAVSRSRADSLDDAENKSVEKAQGFAEQFLRYNAEHFLRYKWKGHDEFSVPLNSLGFEFWSRDGDAHGYTTDIVEISRPTSGWEITLQNQWKEKIVLDSDFQLVSMKRMEGGIPTIH